MHARHLAICVVNKYLLPKVHENATVVTNAGRRPMKMETCREK
jgi:hypothetical protein